MEKEERRAAKERLITLMQAGHSWHESAVLAGVQIGRSAAYHLLRNVRPWKVMSSINVASLTEAYLLEPLVDAVLGQPPAILVSHRRAFTCWLFTVLMLHRFVLLMAHCL